MCRQRTISPKILGVLLCLSGGLILAACSDGGGRAGTQAPAAAGTGARSDGPQAAAGYVGGEICAACHAAEAARWAGSQHAHAMQPASAESVLGDFADAELSYAGVTSRFFRRDGEYWVNTDGPDGSLQDFHIAWTFGVAPLQQYLVELDNGHVQALSMAWDTRPRASGGQRWFHLYPGESVDHADPLHWTGVYQRWNTMCAACHSTGLEKNYDADSDRFETRFASVAVDCEACHGPGSVHAADPDQPVGAGRAVARRWVFAPGARIAARVPAATQPAAADTGEVASCAQCHARRTQLGDDVEAGQPFLDGFRPALLETGLYHADGQIRDEVFVYGSFLQSAMAAAGVVCSDCHDPHSGELRASGNAVCAQCHQATSFDQPAHHHHEAGSPGAQCVACHMPTETYMVVDPRRDHSFRVPRPDLSPALETPNACNACHTDRSADWAAAAVADWFPDGRQNAFHYGQALYAGRHWAADAAPLLERLIDDPAAPAIARATAVSLLANYLDDRAARVLRRVLERDEPLVALAAIDLLQRLPPELAIDLGQRYLTDPRRALRIAAARALLPARERLGERRRQDLNAALVEYLEVQRFNSDRGEGLLNSAGIAAAVGRPDEAGRIYGTAIARFPAFTPAYVNLADLYRALGREQDAAGVLDEGLAANPDDAGLNFARALSLVREGRIDEASVRFDRAVALAPDEPYYGYARGIALNSTGRTDAAVAALTAVHERFPAHRDTLIALATILRDAGDTGAARTYAAALLALAPTDPTARALADELGVAN